MSLDQSVLFTIIVDSINEMLQLQPGQNLTPISIANLLEKSTKMSGYKLSRICHTFMDKNHITRDPPPYLTCFFTDMGKDIVNMVAGIMGFNTSEFFYELTLAFMSIFTPLQPPAAKYDYVAFIVDKIHDQFMRLENERVFKYSTVLYHLFLYYQIDKFPFSVHKLDT